MGNDKKNLITFLGKEVDIEKIVNRNLSRIISNHMNRQSIAEISAGHHDFIHQDYSDHSW